MAQGTIGGSAAAATTTAGGSTASSTSAAALSFVASSPVVTFHTNGTATTTVQVLNPGPAVPVSFELVLFPGGTAVPAEPSWHTIATDPGELFGADTVQLTFAQKFETSFTGASIVVSPSSGAGAPGLHTLDSSLSSPQSPISAAPAREAQSIAATLRRQTSASLDFGVPLLAGAIYALVFLGLVLLLTQKNLKDPVRAGSPWSFKDSWAANITAGGALVATFLTASGSSSTVLPGLQTSSFSLLLALWAGVIALAPLALGLARKAGHADAAVVARGRGDHDKKLTVVSVPLLMLAACVTLLGVGAELATGAVLVGYSTISSAGLAAARIAIAAAGAVIVFYAVRTTATLIETSSQDEPSSMLNRGTETSLIP